MIIPLLTFAGIALKPEKKKWPNFHSFNSVSFLAIRGSSFKYSPNKHNWTIIFGIHSMRESNF